MNRNMLALFLFMEPARNFFYGIFIFVIALPLFSVAASYMAKSIPSLNKMKQFFDEIWNRWKENYYYFILYILGIIFYLVGFWIVGIHNGFIFVMLTFFFLIIGIGLSNMKSREIKNLFSGIRNLVINLVICLSLLFLFVFNFYLNVIPQSQLSNNKELNRVLYFKDYIKPDDTVIALGILPDAVYFNYFLGCRVIDIMVFFQIYNPKFNAPGTNPYEKLWDIIKEEIDNHRVYLYSSLLLSDIDRFFASYPEWMEITPERIRNFFRKNYLLKPEFKNDDGAILYRLTPRGGEIYLPYSTR